MHQLLFQARELGAYAEHYPSLELIEGTVYFTVHFFDQALTIPQLRPVVFIGRDLGEDDRGWLYFQDFESYERGVRFGSPTDNEAVFARFDEAESSGVHDYERALDELLRCSIRRRGTA